VKNRQIARLRARERGGQSGNSHSAVVRRRQKCEKKKVGKISTRIEGVIVLVHIAIN